MLSLLGRLLVNIISIGFTLLLLGMVAAIVIFYHFNQDLPDYAALANYNPAVATRLYAADGKLLAEYAVEKRVYVPLNSVPKRVIQAFVSAEDKTFYTNTGLDMMGIARAIRQNWRNYNTGSHSLSGGSTITQQVVKNFLLSREKSVSRKVKEAILAYRITQVYSKDRILELYLNEIYLGRSSYGVAEASINYFNKSLDELTIEEAAFLAAMPQAPGRSDPVQHYDRAKERRDYVINRMMEDGYITVDEARAAIALPLVLHARGATEMAQADFFAEEVRRELAAKYGSEVLYKGGLFVKTTLNPQLQKYAEEGLRLALTEYDRRKGYRGAVARITLSDWQKSLEKIELLKRFPLFDGERLAVVVETGNSKVTIGFSDGKKAGIDKTSMAWVAHKGLALGDVIITAPSVDKGMVTVHQIPLVNGAMIVMDPHTGRVLAMAGGYAYGGTEFNRATQAKRQPGSAFKPFVYLTAMENGFTPSSIIDDAPVELSQGTGMPVWRPTNYHDDYLGPSTLRTGLEKSRNAMTVRLSQMLGIDKIIEVAERFGIYDTLPKQFSIVLGAQETTLIRLANAYSIIDNGGKKVSPWLIERIDDKNGKTILRRDARACPGCVINDSAKAISPIPPMPADDRPQIVDPTTDYQIISMLEGVVQHGTAARAGKLGRPLAGKTGTTNESRDTWFMGFSPDLVAGIYVGYDQPQSLGKKETGASVALPGFISFMQNALKDTPSTPFRIPPGIQFIKVDKKTGLPPQPGDTGMVIMEAFKEGQAPETIAPGLEQPVPTPSSVLPWLNSPPAYNFPSEEPAPAPAPMMNEPAEEDGYQPAQRANSGRYLPTPRYNRGADQGTGGLY